MEIEEEYCSLGYASIEECCKTNWTFIVRTPLLSRVSHRSAAPCVPTFRILIDRNEVHSISSLQTFVALPSTISSVHMNS